MGIQTAFILGAGLGTRLRPITESRPKLLVPIFGRPLAFLTLDYLLDQEISRFVINTHHLPHVFDRFFGTHHGKSSYRGAEVQLVHEPVLLETAGAIRNARQWIGEDPFLVVNGDILTNIPLTHLLESSRQNPACVTLGLRPGVSQVGRDPATGRVMDFYGKLGINGLAYFLFTGLYVLDPKIYHWIPDEGPVPMMSIFWKLLNAGEHLNGVVLDSGIWSEAGTVASYLQVHQELAGQFSDDQRILSKIPDGVELRGTCAIGKNCTIEPNTVLEDTIVWDGAKIRGGSFLQRCVVCDACEVHGEFQDQVLIKDL